MQLRYGLLAELVAPPGEGMPWRPSKAPNPLITAHEGRPQTA
jgi:hypothetical protein